MKFTSGFAALATTLVGCIINAKGQVDYPVTPDVVPVDYTHDGVALQGFYAKPEGDGPFPAVVIIPDWDGVNMYEQVRATMIAQDWNFAAFAADIYGIEYVGVENRTIWGQLAGTYRNDIELFNARIEAAIMEVAAMPEVDEQQISLIGYCFGGTGVLNYALAGLSMAKAVVSFHGSLIYPADGPAAVSDILVLSGGEDDSSTQIIDLEKRLDAANATWEITRYSNIEHAFTVFPDARYNALADQRSWWSAGHFLSEQFGVFEFESVPPTEFPVTAVDYEDPEDGTALRGYLALPDEKWMRPLPAVVVLPDWTGTDDYEKERAHMLSEKGYVAFAADIYGADMQRELSMGERIALVTAFNSDIPSYVRRIQAAIDQVKVITDADAEEIAVIGYCFGGSGVVYYTMNGGSDAKVAVGFHGSYNAMPTPTNTIDPYLLILSGGDDGLHGNQTIMEDSFNEGTADWEITRYAGVGHGFTEWRSPDYNTLADVRSWESMFGVLAEQMAVPVMEGSDVEMMPTMAPAEGSDVEMMPSMAPDAAGDSPTMSPVEASPADESSATAMVASLGIIAMMAVTLIL